MSKTKLEKLITDTDVALMESEVSNYHLKMFRQVSRQLKRYAVRNKVTEFSLDFGLEFLENHYSMSGKIKGRKFMPIYLHCINELHDYQKNGSVKVYVGRCQRIYDIPAGFQSSYHAYMNYRKEIGKSPHTMTAEKLYLERFFQFLMRNGLENPDKIELENIFKFLETISRQYEKTTVCQNMRTVRFYLKYCFENRLTDKELSSKIPNVNYCRQSRIPSAYTAEEIKILLNTIDLGNPCGKRDYAIVLLIARSGLRAGDISDFRFSDIDWERQKIIRVQKKTGNMVELPLMNDVGDAIIDYLKNARPQTDSDYVFVKHQPPYRNFGSSAVGAVVRRLMQRSGIKLENRKCGSHTLRHSLASRLLECDVPMPVISEILGHSDTKTTMEYLRIDIKKLRTCALEVDI